MEMSSATRLGACGGKAGAVSEGGGEGDSGNQIARWPGRRLSQACFCVQTAKNTFGNDPLKLAKDLEISKIITQVRFDSTGNQRQKFVVSWNGAPGTAGGNRCSGFCILAFGAVNIRMLI